MGDDRFTPLAPELERVLIAWLESYVSRPHPRLGRKGPVCPFVRPSLRDGDLRAVGCAWRGDRPTDVARIAYDAMDLFERTRWRSANASLHALAVVITDMPETGWRLIEAGQRIAKDVAVERGLMIGEFHPTCATGASRNPSFPVNRAPFPMLAIRHMSEHDSLFLHDHPVWLEEYRRRFGRQSRQRRAS